LWEGLRRMRKARLPFVGDDALGRNGPGHWKEGKVYNARGNGCLLRKNKRSAWKAAQGVNQMKTAKETSRQRIIFKGIATGGGSRIERKKKGKVSRRKRDEIGVKPLLFSKRGGRRPKRKNMTEKSLALRRGEDQNGGPSARKNEKGAFR